MKKYLKLAHKYIISIYLYLYKDIYRSLKDTYNNIIDIKYKIKDMRLKLNKLLKIELPKYMKNFFNKGMYSREFIKKYKLNKIINLSSIISLFALVVSLMTLLINGLSNFDDTHYNETYDINKIKYNLNYENNNKILDQKIEFINSKKTNNNEKHKEINNAINKNKKTNQNNLSKLKVKNDNLTNLVSFIKISLLAKFLSCIICNIIILSAIYGMSYMKLKFRILCIIGFMMILTTNVYIYFFLK